MKKIDLISRASGGMPLSTINLIYIHLNRACPLKLYHNLFNMGIKDQTTPPHDENVLKLLDLENFNISFWDKEH